MRWNIFLLVILSGVALLALGLLAMKPTKEPLQIIFKPTATTFVVQETPTVPIPYYIDIAGAVKNPGVYRVIAGSRVEDVIQQAGGITHDANLQDTSLNRASLVSDGQKIIVPTINNPLLPNPTKLATTKETTTSSSKIDINSADKTSLMTIKGIGEKTADKIITRRENKGPFTQLEQLKDEKIILERYWENFLQSATL